MRPKSSWNRPRWHRPRWLNTPQTPQTPHTPPTRPALPLPGATTQHLPGAVLQGIVDALPEHLWATRRKKRSYVNHVLARAEALSAYQPSRKLWVRTFNGHYLPNPALQLRHHADTPDPSWRAVYDVLNLAWVDQGTVEPGHWYPSQASIIDLAKRRVSGAAPAESSDAADEFF